MKVTIDSTEPLADALRVIGALYNVTVAEVDESTAEKEQGTARNPQRSAASNGTSSRRATDTKSTRRSATLKPKRASRKASASTSEIRSWAKASGHAVSDRGTLPASIRDAYAAAHSG